MSEAKQPWDEPMSEERFRFMRKIIGAPSPIGLEGAMTYGVLKPHFESFKPSGWEIHQFKGNAGLVLDTHPGRDDLFSVMVVGHADKIRMQVRSIGEDGKIWIDSDSFLPMTLLGHEALLFSEDPQRPGTYRTLEGGTVEAVGAIHFADQKLRTGEKGIKKEQLYLELQIHGENRKKQVEQLGIRPGDPILLNRPIRRGFGPETFYGSYLDNGLGCFVTAEVARLLAEAGGTNGVRGLFAIATHEEIGRFGSRILARELAPDALIAVDVNHDYEAAPQASEKRFAPLKMGSGFTLSVGSIASEQLNWMIEETASEFGIPMQRDVCGHDTGTDGMAGGLASIDCAATSIGFPIRNMHTASEAGHTRDVLAAIHVIQKTLLGMDSRRLTRDHLRAGHPRLDQAESLVHQGFPLEEDQ